MEIDAYLRFLAALLFVLALIAGAGYVMRRYAPGAINTRPGKRKGRRLSIVEQMPLDPRHRLILVRRDGVEHLLLLGQNADRVIETHISPADDAAGDGADAGERPVDGSAAVIDETARARMESTFGGRLAVRLAEGLRARSGKRTAPNDMGAETNAGPGADRKAGSTTGSTVTGNPS